MPFRLSVAKFFYCCFHIRKFDSGFVARESTLSADFGQKPLAVRNQRILTAWDARQADDARRAAAGLPPRTRRRRRKTLASLAAAAPP